MNSRIRRRLQNTLKFEKNQFSFGKIHSIVFYVCLKSHNEFWNDVIVYEIFAFEHTTIERGTFHCLFHCFPRQIGHIHYPAR